MVYDFHTHTFLSDGVLSPIELIRRSVAQGYKAIALTDHVGMANLAGVVSATIRDCELANRYWDILAIPGVELTHVPARSISECAALAKKLGARLVVVHGETIVEPVEPGTNRAAVTCPHVDILAHPGLLTPEEAELARRNNIFIEISAKRSGHSLTNGHVASVASRAGAKLLVNTDAHGPGDLLTPQFAAHVVRGAGIAEADTGKIFREHPEALLHKLQYLK